MPYLTDSHPQFIHSLGQALEPPIRPCIPAFSITRPTNSLSLMNPLRCLPSSGQTSMTKGFPDLRPVAGRTVSGVKGGVIMDR